MTMRTYRVALIVAVASVCSVVVSAVDTESPQAFRVKLTLVEFLPDSVQTYLVSPSELIITTSRDQHVRHRSKVSDVQAAKLHAVLARLPLDALESRYDDPNVDDGAELSFEIQVGDRAKQISLKNVSQPDLVRLIEAVNEIVPEALRIRWPGVASAKKD